MPHAVDDDDEANIGRLLAGGTMEELGNIHERELDTGEKANDAMDFEDIADDDLAAEEEGGASGTPADDFDLAALANEGLPESEPPAAVIDGEEDPFDDLFNDQGFGDDEGLSPAADQTAADGEPASGTKNQQTSFDTTTALGDSFLEEKPPAPPEDDDDLDQDPAYLEQMRLFREAQERRELPPAPQTADELFSIIHPQFDPHKPPKFSELIPWKRAQYISKQPLKPPKPVHPTKVNLDLAQDQEKSFRLPGPAVTPWAQRQAEAEASGLILTTQPKAEQYESDEDDVMSLGSEAEQDVGNYKWSDIVAVCQNWDIPMEPPASDGYADDHDSGFDQPPDELFGDDGLGELFDQPSSKRQKLASDSERPLPVFQELQILFDNPELETAKLAKRVQLDMNDPRLLIDIQSPDTIDRKRKYGQFKRDNARGLTKDFARRYNISNDEAYDQLKENRQSKIRSTLGGLAIEHALPAVRLQYPFYKVQLSKKECRSFHRPFFSVEPILARFLPLQSFKRKEQRRKTPQELFPTTSQLSQADNSHVMLLEYSEEYPAMMSGFGMGSRLINYYRRKDDADHSRPKFDVGETEVLTREDKSPFSIFGDVDPGTSQPTVSNGLYRAPVFAHNSNSTDFLLISNKTSRGGRRFYFKNIENLHVVGQEFPSVEVPGTHSRKVTDASKRRLRMLSYRMYRKHKKLKNEMIQKHLPGSDIAQNRSKMREFMNYDKDRGWIPRESEIPDEATIRTWIKPEDICLLESMQVGDRQLRDSGYSKDEDMSDDDEGNTRTLDQQLAPWQTTKNFLNACQGKAMLQLHGEGDPTGRGEAFSFIRTSMKGGFKPQGESVEERLGKNSRELGGHTYNVARQNKMYNEAIRKIWDAQRQSLSSTEPHDFDIEDPDEVGTTYDRGRTPSSAVFGRSRREEEVGSTFSRNSARSSTNFVLKIRRTKRNPYTGEVEQIPGKEGLEEIYDKKVIHDLADLQPTGNATEDALRLQKLTEEHARLQRNADRHDARARAKGTSTNAASPEPSAAAASPDQATAPDGAPVGRGKGKKKQQGQTQRKCANCGQIGHIKTNKRSVARFLCNDADGSVAEGAGKETKVGCSFLKTPGRFGLLDTSGAEDEDEEHTRENAKRCADQGRDQFSRALIRTKTEKKKTPRTFTTPPQPPRQQDSGTANAKDTRFKNSTIPF
ncbi:MAG: hypothetical protein Q9162_003391 [Coniocarpon cinnabarinum]